MDLGHEIGQKIRAAIKSKLQELGSYVDDELPEYIMVMLANKRTNVQMNEDLLLFLGENTAKFTDWLFCLIEKLQDVASMAAEAPVEPPAVEEAPKLEPVIKPIYQKPIKTESMPPQNNRSAQSTSVVTRKSPPRVAPPAESKPNSKKIYSGHTERHRISSSVVKPDSRVGSRKRRHTGSDDEDATSKPALPSVVRVQERKPRPTLPPSRQASGSLLRRAVAEAHESVSRLTPLANLSYDPTTPSQPLRSQSFEEKQRQKELLLQQHRELQQQLQRKELEDEEDKNTEIAEEEELVLPQKGMVIEESVPGKTEPAPSSSAPTEPVIELRVSEAEALEYSAETAEKDTRIVAFADSPTGNDEEEEKRKRRRKRAVKSRDRSRSPKFIVTLDGADSKLEDKYKDTKRGKSKKHKPEDFDDFVEVDTTSMPAAPASIPAAPKPEEQETTPQPPAPPVEKVMIRLDTSLSDEEENEDESPVKARPPDRCKFWPECMKGDSCPFFHPTIPCRTFPNCTYGKTCMFVHPMCKFDGRCTNSKCPYLHKQKTRQPLVPLVPPPKTPVPALIPNITPKSNADLPTLEQLTMCKFFPACTRLKCPFHHPAPPPKICRYGNLCTRLDCIFNHPPKKAALKWTAPTKHISERSFAVADQAATKLPVVS